ncbi:MAG: hypothetical protein M1376_15925 [Planctomycetes bacterium]|nr:hypothetical protein [Planctomycetota bacterium]
MRTFIAAVSLVVILAIGAALAPGQSASSSRVGPLGIYQCPDHPGIQATWQAQCPTCGASLQAVQSLDAAADTTPIADTNYPYPGQSRSPNAPYGSSYYDPPQYGSQGYPPSNQYGYPPSGQYGTQGYPPSQYRYPPSGQYGQEYPYGYPPSGQQYGTQGYPPSNQYGYPPQGYPPSGQYGQGYPYGYPPGGQYGTQGYPPSGPYGYGQRGYTPPTEPNRPTEPNNPYAGLLNELNRLFNKRRQQAPQQP